MLLLTFSLLRQRGRQCSLLPGNGRIMSSGALMFRITGRVLANPRLRRIQAKVPSVFCQHARNNRNTPFELFQARMTIPVPWCVTW